MTKEQAQNLTSDQTLNASTIATAESEEKLDVNAILAKYDKESANRIFRNPFLQKCFIVICVLFSAFHLYTAAFGSLAPQLQRSVHLGFALFLIFALYPATSKSSKDIALVGFPAGMCRGLGMYLYYDSLRTYRS